MFLIPGSFEWGVAQQTEVLGVCVGRQLLWSCLHGSPPSAVERMCFHTLHQHHLVCPKRSLFAASQMRAAAPPTQVVLPLGSVCMRTRSTVQTQRARAVCCLWTHAVHEQCSGKAFARASRNSLCAAWSHPVPPFACGLQHNRSTTSRESDCVLWAGSAARPSAQVHSCGA